MVRNKGKNAAFPPFCLDLKHFFGRMESNHSQGKKDEDLRSGKSSGNTIVNGGSTITEQISPYNEANHPDIQIHRQVSLFSNDGQGGKF